jgi:malate dehydrogenase (oxaloacetate-decarboxylating)(NADP+)
MADPVIFAMANPDPEITPEEAHEVRVDAIVATGGRITPTRSTMSSGFRICFVARWISTPAPSTTR